MPGSGPSTPAVFVLTAGVYLSSLLAAGQPRPQDRPPDSPRNRSIAFTRAQADRGLLAYERSCAKCHQADLQGDSVTEAPSLVDDTFLSHWAGQPVRDLFDRLSTKMPADKPKSLSPGAYIDIVAYLLQANGFPAGSEELSLKTESLDEIIPKRE